MESSGNMADSKTPPWSLVSMKKRGGCTNSGSCAKAGPGTSEGKNGNPSENPPAPINTCLRVMRLGCKGSPRGKGRAPGTCPATHPVGQLNFLLTRRFDAAHVVGVANVGHCGHARLEVHPPRHLSVATFAPEST